MLRARTVAVRALDLLRNAPAVAGSTCSSIGTMRVLLSLLLPSAVVALTAPRAFRVNGVPICPLPPRRITVVRSTAASPSPDAIMFTEASGDVWLQGSFVDSEKTQRQRRRARKQAEKEAINDMQSSMISLIETPFWDPYAEADEAFLGKLFRKDPESFQAAFVAGYMAALVWGGESLVGWYLRLSESIALESSNETIDELMNLLDQGM